MIPSKAKSLHLRYRGASKCIEMMSEELKFIRQRKNCIVMVKIYIDKYSDAELNLLKIF